MRLLLLAGIASLCPLAAQAEEIGNLSRLEASGSSVNVQTSKGYTLKIDFLRADLVRVQAGKNGVYAPVGNKAEPIIIKNDFAPVLPAASETLDYHLLRTKSAALRLYKKPLRLAMYRADNQTLLWQELRPLDIGKDSNEQTLASTPDEQIFGGGQQNGQFAFKGKNLEVSYSGGWEEFDRPSPAPFYMSNQGYGVLRHTWSDGSYDFRSADYSTLRHKEARFDAWYLVGDIHQVLAGYTELTGRAPLLPRWAFEYGDADCYNDGDNVKKPGTVPALWSDGTSGKTPDVVLSVAAKYREHDMPGGWILPNDGYGCGYTDLPQVVQGLQKYGFRTGLWTENGLDKIAWEVGTAGTRAQKLDVAWTGQGYQFSLDANAAAAHGITQNADARPFIWTVMGWAGTQRHAVTWTGDQSGSWDYIRWHIPTLIGSGLSGQAYATGDVDGIFGGSAETFTRDLQWKAFTPVLMGMSGWSKTSRKHPWWFDEPYRSINRDYLKLKMRLMPYMYTLAWQAEQTGAPIVRGLMWDHPQDPHAYSEDYKNQFFLGPDLLIAPVYAGMASNRGWRKGVYLPEGRWIDYWDGRVTDTPREGRVLDYPVTLEKLPVLVRAGAIIPMQKPQLYDGQVVQDELTLDIWPHGNSHTTLYEDDGSTRRYQQGAYRLQDFTVQAPQQPAGQGRPDAAQPIQIEIKAGRGQYAGMLNQRRYVLQLHTRHAVAQVQLNGQDLPPRTSRDDWLQSDSGWFYDATDKYGTVHVKTAALPLATRHALTLQADAAARVADTPAYPRMPARAAWLTQDQVQVLLRPQEESGSPLENALDDDAKSWFRTRRDQTFKSGPHEFVLALLDRPLVAGFEIAPRNDQHWKHGQVRDYEVYLSDKNGEWGQPVKQGRLSRAQGPQRVMFAAQAASLLRFRVLSVHSGEDELPIDSAANTGTNTGTNTGADAGKSATSSAPLHPPFQAGQVDAVPPITLASFHVLPAPTPTRAALQSALSGVKPASLGKTSAASAKIGQDLSVAGQPLRMNGVHFRQGLGVSANSRVDFNLKGDWQRFRADIGIDDSCRQLGAMVFQVWGDGRLLYASGVVAAPTVLKPELDLRGVHRLSLRTLPAQVGGRACGNWANASVSGFAGDSIEPLAPTALTK
jgi:alpha-glucosidase (family GH31 glycosyl hydrolase)